MNRRKKGNQILKARAKKANAKLSGKAKSSYVSKAERAKLAAAEETQKQPENLEQAKLPTSD